MFAVSPLRATLWAVSRVESTGVLVPRLRLVPYSTIDVAGSFVAHSTVAVVPPTPA